jgi:hypothetical protein
MLASASICNDEAGELRANPKGAAKTRRISASPASHWGVTQIRAGSWICLVFEARNPRSFMSL